MFEHYLNLTPLRMAEAGKAPTRFLLLREGDIGWADMKGYVLDAAAADRVIKAFQKANVKVPIDYHHATVDVADGKRDKAPAAGWVGSLRYIPGDGLYAEDVEWTPEAQQEIETGAFKYTSPVIKTPHGKITNLHSVALTNRPRTIGAKELLEAAELLDESKGQKDMDYEKQLTALRAAVKTLTTRLHVKAAEDGFPGLDVEAKALSDLMAAVRAAGMDVAEGAALSDLLSAATELLTKQTAVAAEKGGGVEKLRAELTLKTASYEKLAEQVKTLRAELDAGEKAKATSRIDGLIKAAVDDNRIPNDPKAIEAARKLAETNEESFGLFVASLEPYAPSVSVVKGTVSLIGDRAKCIAEARREYAANPKVAMGGQERFYIAACLQETGLPDLLEAEAKALEKKGV